MVTQKIMEGIQHKLMIKLLEFDHTIEYKQGKENMVTDALSRRDPPGTSLCCAITTVQPAWLEDIELSYVNDPDSTTLLKKLASDVGTDSKFTLCQGIFCYKN